MSHKWEKPAILHDIKIVFKNGDQLECNDVWDSGSNQFMLSLYYETFHADYPLCNILEIMTKYQDTD